MPISDKSAFRLSYICIKNWNYGKNEIYNQTKRQTLGRKKKSHE